MIRNFVIALLSAVSLALGHEWAHDFYGATPEAVGSVGIVVGALTLVGVVINVLAAMRWGDVVGGVAGALVGISVLAAYGIHDVAHMILGASPAAITTISVVLGAITVVGTVLNRTSYVGGSA